jgi:hypothetical protein
VDESNSWEKIIDSRCWADDSKEVRNGRTTSHAVGVPGHHRRAWIACSSAGWRR